MKTLSVIIPVYNEESSVAGSITAVAAAVDTVFELDLIVVDDGSTDSTAEAASSATSEVGGRVIGQANAGRFEARRSGLREASGEFTLFVDSRVVIHPDSLRFVSENLPAGRDVWNAHVDIVGAEPYASFWRVLTELAFADYFSNPRTTSFGIDDFDRFPKGTTCFFAPTDVLREAFDHYTSRYDDSRNSNDDTPIIRRIAETHRINISPHFGCDYRPRATLRGFLRHAYHRGIVFFDGHVRPESRFFLAGVSVFPLTVAALVIAARKPMFAVRASIFVAAFPAGVALVGRRRPVEALAFAALSPLYGVAHVAGMWNGLVLAGRSRRSKSHAPKAS